MKIVVIGTRGIPNIQGGVETHCENLYPRLVKLGCDVTIIRRSEYIEENNKLPEFKGVKLIDLYSPRRKSFEAIIHSFIGVIKAKQLKADILHIHAIGPAIVVPFARLLGMKVVMTHHGPDYDRQKWNALAKCILRLGERMGAMFANRLIVISKVIKDILVKKYLINNKIDLIYNGVDLPKININTDYLESIGLEPNKYIIAVARFVKEKGLHDLVNAYIDSEVNLKLVLVGDADHEDDYSMNLKNIARKSGVVLTGFIKGEKLSQVFSHAKLFVLPSYHEGLPIALLEAMSYNLNVLVSDIPANLEVNLDKENYFKSGDIEDLRAKLKQKSLEKASNDYSEIITRKYNWDIIAQSVKETYNRVK